jgi:hypothetical protein
MAGKQRCMEDAALHALRWDKNATIFFDYVGAGSRQLRVEDPWYSYTKPLVWHYMSPRRLLRLERLLYPWRGAELPLPDTVAPTNADVSKRGKRCYPGVPNGGLPPRGVSVFEGVEYWP